MAHQGGRWIHADLEDGVGQPGKGRSRTRWASACSVLHFDRVACAPACSSRRVNPVTLTLSGDLNDARQCGMAGKSKFLRQPRPIEQTRVDGTWADETIQKSESSLADVRLLLKELTSHL